MCSLSKNFTRDGRNHGELENGLNRVAFSTKLLNITVGHSLTYLRAFAYAVRARSMSIFRPLDFYIKHQQKSLNEASLILLSLLKLT